MNLLRREGPVLRIGHRGAAALAPPNTIAGVEAALAHGVDMIELDVFGRPDRTLVLGRSRRELGEEPVTLEDVFAFLAENAPEKLSARYRHGACAAAGPQRLIGKRGGTLIVQRLPVRMPQSNRR